jgi:isocitrate/isopropylmalate dehydrogenase
VLGAIAFLAVFSYLAARFDYPEVLDGSASDVLPKLLALPWAVIAAISMMLGLMRWPSVQWHLAQLQASATPEQ